MDPNMIASFSIRLLQKPLQRINLQVQFFTWCDSSDSSFAFSPSVGCLGTIL